MASFHTGLEKQRLEQLAREYHQLLLADARTREHLTLEGAADVTAITGQIAQMPNASWELVVVDPKREGGRDESPSR